MPRLTSALAAAAIISTFAAGAMAQQAPAQSGSIGTAVPTPPAPAFDLGVDVSGVGQTPVAAHQFLLTLPADQQQKMMADCQHYIADPTAAAMQDTVLFCKVLGSG